MQVAQSLAIDHRLTYRAGSKIFPARRRSIKRHHVRMFTGTVQTRDRLRFGRDSEQKVTAISVFDNGSAVRRGSVSAGEIGQLRYTRYRSAHNGPIAIGCSKEFVRDLTTPAINGAGALMDYCCYGANLAARLLGRPESVTGMRGFFLADPDLSRYSLISMMLLIFVARQFLRQLLIATSRVEEEDVLRLFVWSLTLLTGVSYIYATTLAGPLIAIQLISVGGLGVAFLIWIFVRELT